MSTTQFHSKGPGYNGGWQCMTCGGLYDGSHFDNEAFMQEEKQDKIIELLEEIKEKLPAPNQSLKNRSKE